MLEYKLLYMVQSFILNTIQILEILFIYLFLLYSTFFNNIFSSSYVMLPQQQNVDNAFPLFRALPYLSLPELQESRQNTETHSLFSFAPKWENSNEKKRCWLILHICTYNSLI